MPRERILFVTGRLAEFALRRVAEPLCAELGADCQIAVLPISVAALMNVDWVLRKLETPQTVDRIVLPGWCQGEIERIAERTGVETVLGPKDLHDLPEFFGRAAKRHEDFGEHCLEILAEINHAPRMSDEEILAEAERYRAAGADLIDVGCVPGESWSRVGDVVLQLRDAGHRVSIDSFDRAEVEAAVAAGAELVLSCQSENREWLCELDAELVVIPDDPRTLSGLEETIDFLTMRNCRFRVDPVLEPIGFGFAASLARYAEVRRRWPEVEMMMGIGNLTELTEVDSAGVNVMLAGFCQELGIRSALTTEVINWARSAVRELDLARRLVHYSVKHQVLPKHLDAGLVMLRDAKVSEYGREALVRLAASLTDPNYRIFVEQGELHIMNRDGYWHGADPFELFDQLKNVDPQHAFYLGYELSKAVTALTLGKQYRQDQALDWGFLTVPEQSAHERRRGQTGQDETE